MPRSLVVADDAFRWRDGAHPRPPVLRHGHLRGCTSRASPCAIPGIPPELRGTYAGLGHEAAIAHLVGLGVTAVELLPVHESVPEAFLPQRGLTNYWGYNTIGYFAPHQGYSAAVRAGQPGGQVAEFKAMVDALHAAGLEVLLDVVFNHTAEGDQLGPTLCFRGLDNPAYYRLDPGDPRHYVDTTGCGNSLNAGDPVTLQLIMDSLRYWLTEMRVDGFRFDLATSSGPPGRRLRAGVGVLRPGLAGPGGVAGQADRRAVGRRPDRQLRPRPVPAAVARMERQVPRHHARLLAQPPGRPAASSPPASAGRPTCTRGGRRRPTASVNLITVHDGFTLRDLVSYDDKHNEANGESNRDGTDDNRSWNCGAEGPTDDPAVLALRARQSRAMLATLLLSFGVPMLLGGDELGRTQQGNNNAYCQDNEITWFDWSAARRRPAGLHQAAGRLPQGSTRCSAAAGSWPEPKPRNCAGTPRPAPA